MNFLNKNMPIKALLLKWKWVILCLFSLLLRSILSFYPAFVETYYSRGLFSVIRWVFDNSLSYSPVPLIYFFYGLVAYFIIKLIVYFFNKTYPLSIRLTNGLFSLVSFASFMVFGFMFLWGFNYIRKPLNEQMKFKIVQLDTFNIGMEHLTALYEALESRKKITDQAAYDFSISNDFENNMRRDVSFFLYNNGFKYGGRLRGRQITPNGTLSRFGIAGIYMPYIGESNIDNATHPLAKPFTMAHEMAHGYGWTDEGTANFIAYLACINSDDILTQYSGYLMYYRYVSSNFRKIRPWSFKRLRQLYPLPEGIKNDLEAINKRIDEYPTWFETDKINNAFLKAQGVKEGTASYSRVVTLVYSWRNNSEK
jgi:Protein of unknown function (DUF3810)